MKKTVPEIISLGMYDAALVHKNVDKTRPRRVRLYEVEAVLEDGGTTHIGETSYPIRAGNIIVGKPGQMRHTELPFKCLYLHLLVEDERLCTLLDALPDVYTPSDPSVGESLREVIASYAAPDVDGGMGLAARLCEHLSCLIRDGQMVAGTARERGNHAHVIEQAIAFMDAHEQEEITLSRVAEHVHLSRIYFHNLFVAATGRTPRRYLLERRISHARRLLMTTEMTVGQIARECGFSSQSYFNQVFQRELGESPMQYKKEMSLRY